MIAAVLIIWALALLAIVFWRVRAGRVRDLTAPKTRQRRRAF